MTEIIPSDWNKINIISSVGLADCPWPIEDSHCSVCTIYPYGIDKGGLYVWGEYDENANRKRFHAQEFCSDSSSLKRLVVGAARFRTTDVPEGDGLYIGIVDYETMTNETKLYDPSTWTWAGYLSTLPGGVPTEQYIICIDNPECTLDVTKKYYLLMITNGSYEVCGWEMTTFGASDFPVGVQPLYKYYKNEPAETDGWAEEDNYFRGLIIPYEPTGGAIVEGYCQIKNPVFPVDAQEGTPYSFTFDIDQLNAFPCGCPETIVWQIFDRDTNMPLGSATTFELECGYTGVTGFNGTISFTGTGVFHGQLRAGHKISETEWAVDDTHDFNVTLEEYICENWTNQTDCINAGCYWCDGQCQSTPCDEQVYLEEAITCGWVNGWRDHGPLKTTFQQGEQVNVYIEYGPDTKNFNGDIIGFKWYHNGSMVWEDTYQITEDWYGAYWHLYWAVSSGTGYIEAYWNNQYMGKTNNYTVELVGDTIADIIEEQSNFKPGPFQPNTFVSVASIRLKNIGDLTGDVYYNLYEYPNTANEKLLVQNTTTLNAGSYIDVGFNATTPDTIGTWQLGIKVWGATETEPIWGSPATRIINSKIL